MNTDHPHDNTKAALCQPHRLVLASRSPRRQELLLQAGLVFDIFPAEDSIEEPYDSCRFVSAAEFVERQAWLKAQNVAEQLADPAAWILGCDTAVVCEGEILGKPADRADARRMLRKLAGTVHNVLSGLCLWTPLGIRQEVVETRLQMERLDDATLEAYLDTQKWVGKAGAFGYQDGNDWLRILSGTASNVVGLPIERVMEWLAEA